MKNNLKSIKIRIYYDDKLKKITKKDFEESVVSDNLQFAQILNFIFSFYPDMQKNFGPGTLGFLLNGQKPNGLEKLKEGDEIKMFAFEMGDIRKTLENQISIMLGYYQADITLDKIKEIIFNEKDGKEFNNLIDHFSKKIDNIEEMNQVMQLLNNGWNYFPHKCLNGFCPMEKILEYQKNQKTNLK